MAVEPTFSLLLSGDSMITRGATRAASEPTRGLRDLIRSADLAFTNLEVLPNDFQGHPAADNGGTHLAAHARVVDELIDLGFDLVAAATNHALDYSIAGLLATIAVLEEKGLPFAGVGRNLAEARMPIYLDHPAGSLAMLSCCSTFSPGQQAGDQRADMPGRPGLNPLRYDRVLEVTAAQLDVLRTIAQELGLERQRQEVIQLGFGFPPDAPDLFPFLGSNFRAAEQLAIRTAPRAKDLEAIASWVREARGRADLVLVSMHAHEQGERAEEPAEFIPNFARRMVDEGADLVVGHGPHLLRGMELYRGKPIFYSLGNFIAQNDLVYKIPADAYERFRVDPSQTPGELFASRSQHGQKSFPADARYWETVLPICRYAGGELQGIELVPVSLGHGEAVHQRGRPRLARDAQARAILERFATLSEPLGTEIVIDGERAAVALDR